MATILVFSMLLPAKAMKSDTSERLSPKSFGTKIKNDMCSVIFCKNITSVKTDHPSSHAKEDWQNKRLAQILVNYPKLMYLKLT